VDGVAEGVATGAGAVAFVAVCVIITGLASWPFARRYLDQPSDTYRKNHYALSFVWSVRAIRPAALVFALSLALCLLAWAVAEAA
jgi:hypothetical protein